MLRACERAGLAVRCLLALLFISLLGCSSSGVKPGESSAPQDHKILFVYRDWHTSIVLSTSVYRRYSKLAAQSSLLQEALGDYDYIRIGWGDGTYFTGKSKTLGAATKALFASDFSALQLIGYTHSSLGSIPPETIAPLLISAEGMAALVAYIDESFLLTEAQLLTPLPAYVEDAGVFFQSRQDYGLFSNCNTWSGRALQAAGVPIRSRLHLTAQSVFEQVQKVSQQQALATSSAK